jgi:hypothetical protein
MSALELGDARFDVESKTAAALCADVLRLRAMISYARNLLSEAAGS